MTTLVPLATAPLEPAAPVSALPLTMLDTPARRPVVTTAATRLTRLRGGTASPTVDVIRLADGRRIRTDLVRLTPGTNAYSLNLPGGGPQHLAHYRPAPWQGDLAGRLSAILTRILANSLPWVTTAELTDRLRASGYRVGAAGVRAHHAIAATQAAIWSLVHGTELDTALLDRPVAARARIGHHPSAGRLPETSTTGLDWRSHIPSGETTYLELELAHARQLSHFSYRIGSDTARHDLTSWLEQSVDGQRWTPVSGSKQLHAPFHDRVEPVRRSLGVGATIASSRAGTGTQGHRYYRIAVRARTEGDSYVELRDIRLGVAGSGRFANPEPVVQLYDFLVAQATGTPPRFAELAPQSHGAAHGPFALARPALLDADHATIRAGNGQPVWGPLPAGTPFYVHPWHTDTGPQVRLRLAAQQVHAELLVGSAVPDGPETLTPLVTLTTGGTINGPVRTIALGPLSAAQPHRRTAFEGAR